MSSFSDKDRLFMLRALELAALGRGYVSPNPMVGCVIVQNEKIIGEGWHKNYGQAHAEVNAVNAVDDKKLLEGSTVYVTLEPCAHYGKTPPCAKLLVDNKVKKVIIACTDPNPLVAGKGIETLEKTDIEVCIGLMKKEAQKLNVRFLTAIKRNRPYIILKWAETADGFIARNNYDSKWISNDYSRKLVHKWRAWEDAIMVGTTTAKVDNPTLNVRDWKGNDPIRVVIDKKLVLEKTLNLFNGDQPTLCYNLMENKISNNTTYVKLVETKFLETLLSDLHVRKIQSVLVEGGTQILQSLIDNNLWDETRIFIGNIMFEEGIKAPVINGPCSSQEEVMGDQLKIIRNEQNELV